MAEHGIEFVKLCGTPLEVLDRDAGVLGQFREFLIPLRQEFMQRRVEQADRAGKPGHGLEDANEIAALCRQQFLQRPRPPRAIVGKDHLAHGQDAVGIEEHVFGTAQADALGAELAGHAAILRRFGIGAHSHPPVLVGPFHQRAEVAGELGFDGRHAAGHDLSAGAIERQHIAFVECPCADLQAAACHVDGDCRGAGDAGAAHAARHHGRMAGHAAARGEDALGRMHAVNVFRARLDPNQDHRIATVGPFLGGIGIERDPPRGRAR